MEQNKTGKYFKYAIGEIVLVVVGILIALSINNWNEQRKEGIKEKKVLIDLVENLEFNLSVLDSINSNFRADDESSKIIINVIENTHTYHDSLDYHFARALNAEPLYPLSFVAYESMKNTGFDIVRNDLLKKEIINLFEMTFSTVQIRQDNRPVLWEFTRKRFMNSAVGWSYKPFNFHELIKDKEFHSLINYIKSSRRWIGMAYEESRKESHRVLQLIKDKLDK